MDRTIRTATISLPDLDEPGLYLSRVDTLDNPRGMVQDFQYGDASLRALELSHTQLVTGRISGLTAARVLFDDVRASSVVFDTCDLSAVQWSDSKLSRVVFRNCKIMGASFDGIALDDVLFEGCKLDYTALSKVRATGAAAFTGCSLTEATFEDCDLSRVVLDDCTLRATQFGRGRYQGLDLRGNDLSNLLSAHHLSKVVIGRDQESELAAALLAELDVTFGDET
ncbi:pentapeptide repeat-containing protein [Streptomyces xanthochromogenes]|uniref:pentapeptide repeat-containing protein n=1 Tax=Streptomyces xanthochromogenes TaxID=67384 RepID=UPI00343680B3